MRSEYIKLDAIDSTNNYAKSLVSKSGAENNAVIWAKQQLQGRGQHGNSWHSVPGESLTFSMIRRFKDVSAQEAILINFAVSLGICRALDPYELPSLCIKWPNDIMSAGGKLGGILIETQLRGSRVESGIIGVGMNVNNQDFPELPSAVSMSALTDTIYDLENLLYEIVDCIDLELASLDNAAHLRTRYERRLFRREMESNFSTAARPSFKAVILGVSTFGKLRIQLNQTGEIEEYDLGQISMHF